MRILSKLIKYSLGKLTLIKFKILYRSRFKFKWSCSVSPNLKVRMSENGTISLGENVYIRDHVILNSTGGIIHLDEGVFLSDGVYVNAREAIIFQKNVLVGQGAKFYDHDHDYKHNLKESFLCSPIQIGQNVWIGADTIILRGSTIGDDTVIGAASLVNRDIPPNVVLINQREYVMKSYRRIK